MKRPDIPRRANHSGDAADRARADIRLARKRRRAALRADRRRFTADRRRRSRFVVGGATAVGLLLLVVFGVAYSPLMAVRTITVLGASRLDATQVQTALAGELGTPLPLVNIGEIATALAAFPAVQSFQTESLPPSTLIVRIVERIPIGALARDGEYQLIDVAGVVLSTTPDAPEGVPILDVAGTDSEAFVTLGVMLRTLPDELRARAAHAGASSGVDAWFQLSDGPRVVWGDASSPMLKLRVLQALLITSGGASDINVAAPLSPFTR